MSGAIEEVAFLSALTVWLRKRCIKRNRMGVKSEQEIQKAKEGSLNTLNALYKQIADTAEGVVPLYDAIEDFFFQDVDYQKIRSIVPLWMMDAGRSPESGFDKGLYEQLRSVYNDPISNRIIHWADVQAILAAFQDRVMAVRNYLEVIYKYLPAYCLYDDSEYENSTRVLDDTSDKVHTAINNVFVSLCSSFDLFTKVVYECSKYDASGFAKYKKLKSRDENILYKKGNYGFDELKADGMLYSEPFCIRTACSFRDEYIHNGAWDYRCAIYYPLVEGGKPVEPFVVMPDLTDEGYLVTSGSRNKFYAKSTKINVFLPGFVKDVIAVLTKTVETQIDLLRKKIVAGNKDKATEVAVFQMLRNKIISKKVMMGNKYTDDELAKDVDFLLPRFPEMHPIITELCRGITLNIKNGNWLLSCGFTAGRPYRMPMFVLLLNESANLKSDHKLAYHLLKEAYLLTDNIYNRLKECPYPFNLSDYLTELENNLPNRNPAELESEEVVLYNSLPNRFKVYRGMCDDEKQARQFGISWTLDKDYALNYVFYKKNEVKGTVGWRAEMEIDKSDIFAVWGVVGKGKEIVINPTKCKDVEYTKVVK